MTVIGQIMLAILLMIAMYSIGRRDGCDDARREAEDYEEDDDGDD